VGCGGGDRIGGRDNARRGGNAAIQRKSMMDILRPFEGEKTPRKESAGEFAKKGGSGRAGKGGKSKGRHRGLNDQFDEASRNHSKKMTVKEGVQDQNAPGLKKGKTAWTNCFVSAARIT